MDFNEGRLVESEKAKNIENRHIDMGWGKRGRIGRLQLTYIQCLCKIDS